jgi:hypothetical protein
LDHGFGLGVEKRDVFVLEAGEKAGWQMSRRREDRSELLYQNWTCAFQSDSDRPVSKIKQTYIIFEAIFRVGRILTPNYTVIEIQVESSGR